MNKETNLEKLKKLDSSSSTWAKDAQERRENKVWFRKSTLIAIAIVRSIRANGISQKELADSMGVSPQYISKILKGKENLSLETISKLEEILKVSLIEIPKMDAHANNAQDLIELLVKRMRHGSHNNVIQIGIEVFDYSSTINLIKCKSASLHLGDRSYRQNVVWKSESKEVFQESGNEYSFVQS